MFDTYQVEATNIPDRALFIYGGRVYGMSGYRDLGDTYIGIYATDIVREKPDYLEMGKSDIVRVIRP